MSPGKNTGGNLLAGSTRMRCVFCELSVCAACFSDDYLIALLSCLPLRMQGLCRVQWELAGLRGLMLTFAVVCGVRWTERINVNIYCCVRSCLTCMVGDIDYVVVIKRTVVLAGELLTLFSLWQ